MPGLLKQRNANEWLDLGPTSNWLLEPGCPIARSDIRKVGDSKPVWRWAVEDLEAFRKLRRVEPGQANPMDQQ